MMPARGYEHDLECDVCGDVVPCIEFSNDHEEGEPHNSVAVCVVCLLDAIDKLDGVNLKED